MVLLKFGTTPKINSTSSSYDKWQLFCPNDMTSLNNDTYYMFFVNTATVNGFTGFVGIGMRELTAKEFSMYCPNSVNTYTKTTPPVLDDISTDSLMKPQVVASSNSTTNQSCKFIANDFYMRVFLSGCFYLDTTVGEYKSDGTEVHKNTNINATFCEVTHFTEFAGGFIVLPASINFESAFESASIDKSPIIYATVFTIVGLYICLAVLCRVFDVRDRSKKGVSFLNGNRAENLYEVIVFTGNRRNAGTESKVSMLINGELEQSHVIQLQDSKRRVLQRASVDTFIVSTER